MRKSTMASQVEEIIKQDSMDESSMALDMEAQKLEMEKQLKGASWT